MARRTVLSVIGLAAQANSNGVHEAGTVGSGP